MIKTHNINLFAFAELIKYKLSLAVAFSSVTGYFLYAGKPEAGLVPLITGTFLLASGSAVLNQYTERGADSKMERTSRRPLPLQKVSLSAVRRLIFILMTAGSLLLLLEGIVPFALGIINVILYNVIYTGLKKITPLAIIPGAIVGAVPPLIGFTSAGGTMLNPEILLFSGFMFLWQIPHFWLLLIRYSDDYRRAGFAAISDYLSEGQIKIIVFIWIMATSLLLMGYSAFTGIFTRYLSYLLLILNPLFIVLFYRMLFSGKNLTALKAAFVILNIFGFLFMFLLIADSILRGS